MSIRNVARLAVAAVLVCAFLALPARVAVSTRLLLAQALFPLVRCARVVLDAPGRLAASLASRRRIEEENALLRRQCAELRGQVSALGGLKEEKSRLQRLLEFRDSSPLALLPAEVIGRDTQRWYSGVVIDKGARRGVRPGMAVVAEGGVVGKVVDCAPEISTVLLIVDRRSRVGGVVARTRETGLAGGSSFNTLRLDYLPRRPDARPGDRVLTSGLGGVYPRGLEIGTVIGVYDGETGLSSCADISPSVDFSRLEAVFVVTGRRAGEEGDVPR
ncbi:MAG: rod shape-determining protein MreC [Candidatus Aureabacteria bacterium]|nr:rod shape-determining protein MreC [Candidatus Auribacterota bacterium]NLW93014.1 rod shape-determining protein MreC [Chlamydiota bacterium]HOE27690.1 rod shape-determining protein MreC [bacterium]